VSVPRARARSEAPELPPWIERQLLCARYRIDTGAYRMHVMEAGRGPDVVMIHGNPTWGFLYRHIAANLRDTFRCVMPDLIGLGLSDKPRQASAHRLDWHAAWLHRTLETVVSDRYILVVQDWGGPIGVLAAGHAWERVAGLVVLNTVLGPPREGFRPTAFHRFARVPLVSDLVFRGFGFPQRGMRSAQGDPTSVAGDVARAYRWPLRRLQDRSAPLALARMVPDSFEHPSIPELRRCHELVAAFDGPSAIVWGDRDPVLGRAFGRVSRALPSAHVTRTQGGHFLQEEVPDIISAAIRDVAQRAGLGR